MTVSHHVLPRAFGNVRDRPMSRIPSWIRAILAIHLQTKVLGANLVILGIAAAALWALPGARTARPQDLVIVLGALALGAAVSYALVRVALKPVDDLERIARRVSQGRLSERVPPSLVADSGLAHLARTMNEMLDTLSASRDRMRKLGADVVYEQERERAEVARDLQDSVAQTLAAASFQISAAINDIRTDTDATYLTDARDLLRTALEEIRNVSRSLYPRVAEDLGLPAALEALGDATRQRSLIDVKVHTEIVGVIIPVQLFTTLYRVAQESLRNVEKHADAATAIVSLSARPGLVELEISDDGCGFDSQVTLARANSALERIRERLSLAGGELHIDSTRDSGTRVVARIRMETEAA
jgi:two-component system sensor histidine kinase UhpB